MRGVLRERLATRERQRSPLWESETRDRKQTHDKEVLVFFLNKKKKKSYIKS